jgi:hypothetical protein
MRKGLQKACLGLRQTFENRRFAKIIWRVTQGITSRDRFMQRVFKEH